MVKVIALEINDAGIVAADTSDVVTLPSPGIALIEGRSIVVGREAVARARLQPRKSHDSFWTDVSTEALKRPFPSHICTADLVFRHLQQIWREIGADADAVLLAVPGSYDERQLGLILGVARSCQMPVTGLVDAAVVAVRDFRDETPYVIHVDLQLHAAVATLIERSRRVSRVRARADDRIGLKNLHAQWAAHIAADFVRTTRFDPLHLADSEQTLHDRLPGWLQQLNSSARASVSMEAGGRSFTIDLSHDDMVAAVLRLYDHLAESIAAVRPDHGPVSLVVTDRIALLPGLAAYLSRRCETTVTALRPAAAAIGAARAVDQISAHTDSLPLVTSLDAYSSAEDVSRRTAVTDLEEQPHPARRRSPSHLVYRGVAYPISTDPLVIALSSSDVGRALHISRSSAGASRTLCTVILRDKSVILEDHGASGTTVNGRRLAGSTELAAGDVVCIGSIGEDLLMVSMVD